MNELVTMIIIGMTGAGGIAIDTSTTSMEQCVKIEEKMKIYSDKRLFSSLDRQISVECIPIKKEIK